MLSLRKIGIRNVQIYKTRDIIHFAKKKIIIGFL